MGGDLGAEPEARAEGVVVVVLRVEAVTIR